MHAFCCFCFNAPLVRQSSSSSRLLRPTSTSTPTSVLPLPFSFYSPEPSPRRPSFSLPWFYPRILHRPFRHTPPSVWACHLPCPVPSRPTAAPALGYPDTQVPRKRYRPLTSRSLCRHPSSTSHNTHTYKCRPVRRLGVLVLLDPCFLRRPAVLSDAIANQTPWPPLRPPAA